MAQPTKEQWAEIEKQLESLFSAVYLRCDGYLVYVSLKRVEKNRLGIVVGVNGWQFKGKWLPLRDKPMSEEARRFWFPRERAVHSRKMIMALENLYGKRAAKEKGVYRKVMLPTPIWNSARSFIRHLKKHNESIEVIDYETYRAALDALPQEVRDA